MRKLKLLFDGIAIAILVTGCSKIETKLSVSFTKEPSGGFNVNSVSAQFEGKLDAEGGFILSSPEPEQVDATVEWWWENAYASGDEIVKSENVTFSNDGYTTKSTSYCAGSGYVLLNYYWVEIHWTDDKGSHSIQSSKAYCNYKRYY